MIAAGDRLRDLREDKGKTQAEISSLLGTTQQIYSLTRYLLHDKSLSAK